MPQVDRQLLLLQILKKISIFILIPGSSLDRSRIEVQANLTGRSERLKVDVSPFNLAYDRPFWT